MEASQPPIPGILSQPLSVDFIEKELPQFHEAFKASGVQYDPNLKRFLAAPHASTMLSPGYAQDNAPDDGRPQPTTHKDPFIPARQQLIPIKAMTFWNKILGKAMNEFKTTNLKAPKAIVEKHPEYNIRNLTNWHDIYLKLLKAIEVFNGTDSKAWHAIKKTYRNVIDKHGIARQAVDFIPDMEYISPIKAAAAKNTSTVRNAVGSGFDKKDLEKTFGNIEFFLTIFPGDKNIECASVDLIACTLKAVEGAIAYYLSRTMTRALKGVSETFEKGLVDSIGEISGKCEHLREVALDSHIYSNRKGMQLILDGVSEGLQGIEDIRLALSEQLKQNSKIIEMFNFALHLFWSGEEERKKELEEWRKKMKIEENSRHAAGMDTAIVERHIISILPMQASQLGFQAPQHIDYPHQLPQAPSGPLRGVLTSPEPFGRQLSVHYPSFQPLQQQTVHVNTLLDILRVSRVDEEDVASILDSEESINLEHRGRAKSIMLTNNFRAWATSSKSWELLVQGDPGGNVVEAGPALSLVSATVIQALRSQDRFIPLIFFCQQHAEPDDLFSGPSILFRSLITQLLRQYFANFTFWEHDIDVASLQRADVDVLHLRPFFEWLVRQVPQEKTLVCVLDGVEAYETREYENDFRVVIDSLLGLAREPGLLPALKFMATSHMGTVSLGECFNRRESSILEMMGLPPSGEEDAMMGIGGALQP